MNDVFDRARSFLHRNARPLDLARFRFHFEGGLRDDVLDALSHYQNRDGGFGHALEPDAWNPHSSPIQTWAATGILREIGFHDPGHPVVAGLLRYLASGSGFNGRCWFWAIPTNNDHPHAPWWTAGDDYAEEKEYNPTASLAAFFVAHGKADPFHAVASRVAQEAIRAYLATGSHEMHLIRCYVELWENLRDVPEARGWGLDALFDRLRRDVPACVEKDAGKWSTEYVCRPSQLVRGLGDPFLEGLEDLARTECTLIAASQRDDGGWPITWTWSAYPQEYAVSANWWSADRAIRHLLFLRNMGELRQ